MSLSMIRHLLENVMRLKFTMSQFIHLQKQHKHYLRIYSIKISIEYII
jgi:hypothetical protein